MRHEYANGPVGNISEVREGALVTHSHSGMYTKTGENKVNPRVHGLLSTACFKCSVSKEASAVAYAPFRVLVVDDNPTNRLLLSRLSQSLGHVVEEAENGEIAVQLAERSVFDVILMDLAMPVMDGLAATKHIRAQDQTVPVVAVSAHLDQNITRSELTAAGFTGFIAKPVDFRRMAEEIHVLANARRRAASRAPE